MKWPYKILIIIASAIIAGCNYTSPPVTEIVHDTIRDTVTVYLGSGNVFIDGASLRDTLKVRFNDSVSIKVWKDGSKIIP
jgi:hypothetical protein